MIGTMTIEEGALNRKSLEQVESVSRLAASNFFASWFPFHRLAAGEPASRSISAPMAAVPDESPDAKLARMVATITPETSLEEIDFGPARGAEEW